MSSLTYPGVYIREFTPPTPIEGVSTSIAAFLGPFTDGPPMEPTKIFAWDDFKRAFGEQPPAGLYTWYAVRSFFENGGTICYALRVSNATFGQAALDDSGGADAVVIRARRAGALTPAVTAEVQQTNPLPANARLYRPTGSISGSTASSIAIGGGNAARFRAGDRVTWGSGKPALEVLRVEGNDLRMVDPVPTGTAAPTGTLRLADLPAGARTVRAQNVGALEAGSRVRLTQTGQTAQALVVEEVRREPDVAGAPVTFRITFRTGLAVPWPLETNDTDIEAHEFTLTIRQGTQTFTYPRLAMDPLHPRYFASVVATDANAPVYARPTDPPNPNRPAATGAGAPVSVPSGTADNPGTLTTTDYANALSRLRAVEDVSIVCVPDQTNPATQANVIAHCRDVNRFAILDPPRGLDLFGATSIDSYRNALDSPGGYAALYYPWIQVMDAGGTSPIFIPPSGAVAGIYADTDERRGVHKAPAGTESVLNALGVERPMGNDEQGQLNLRGINVLRVFRAGARPVVWGARTTEPANRYWQYVNIRRLFTFLERSLERALQESLFKPNTPQLWKELARSATAFLTKAWRDGALFGERPEDAFYVRIDEALNPPSERALGRLYIEIGIKPAYPAEFIVVRIGVWEGGSEVTES
jgi:uncharacterized protein